MLSHIYKCPKCQRTRELYSVWDEKPAKDMITCDFHTPFAKMECVQYNPPSKSHTKFTQRISLRKELLKLKAELNVIDINVRNLSVQPL